MLKTLVSSFLARHRAARLTRPTRLAAALMGCCLMAVLLLSCSSDENEYCSYPCRFVFNTQRHGQSAALMGATSGTGVFCKVTTTIRGGAQYYRFENNGGLTDNVIFTQEDKQTTVLLGLNGSLIVGWSNLDDPKQFYAFDGECPNCFSPDAIPVKSRQLTLSTSGMASCAVCHRQYNLNTGGNVASGDNGRKLNRYHASCAPDGTVSVIN